MTTNLSDTSTWLPLDGLARGFDANKAALSRALAGRAVTLTRRDNVRIALRFTADRVSWARVSGDGVSGDGVSGDLVGRDRAGESGEDTYEAFEVDDGLYYAQWPESGQSGVSRPESSRPESSRPEQAVSLFLDTEHNRALIVTATIGEPGPGRTAVRHEFMPATIDDAVPAGAEPSSAEPDNAELTGAEPDNAELTGAEPAPSLSLIGRRALWVYSTEHAYEHVYLSPHWYTWQCLAGPERGLADTDENTVYELRPGIYVFAWREKVIPCGAVTVADHRDATALRSHGSLFGLDETGTRPVHFTFGAYGRLLSVTAHPDGYSPAHPDEYASARAEYAPAPDEES